MLMDNNLEAGTMVTDNLPKPPAKNPKEDALNRRRASEQHRSKVNKPNEEKKNQRQSAQRVEIFFENGFLKCFAAFAFYGLYTALFISGCGMIYASSK
ncbi:unnamed protein product [Ranitomeya imitator]|uniref:Uncharacterized protein n=1 Tax=Ranitomeya imitator TaxID=111125 RepID=A0ABN9MCR9_9NEOB|nr:unnamed protein product [Ranitomeya imitator]